jgi:hypothetical protein
VLDHFKKRFADGEEPTPPAALDGRRSFSGTRLARKSHALAIKAKQVAEEKRRRRARSKLERTDEAWR